MIRTYMLAIVALALGAMPCGTALGTSSTTHPTVIEAVSSSATPIQQTTSITPCQWVSVPSIAFSDTNAHYWAIGLVAVPGVTLTITGTFPAARFVSIETYLTSAHGMDVAALGDYQFPPDSGSTNPFASGGQRGVGTYTLQAVFAARPAQPAPGTLYINVPAGALVSMIYRVYVPDKGVNAQGGVPLPAVAANSAGGPVSCPGTHSFAAGTSYATSPRLYSTATTTTTVPIYYHVSAAQLGGYGNLFGAYLFASLPGSYALYVIRFKAPVTPKTFRGEAFIPGNDLRYWSLCLYNQNEQPYVPCLFDEQAAVDSSGYATIVMGPWWERPTNAAAPGVTWLALGTTPPPLLSLFRQTLPSAAYYPQSALAVPLDAPASSTMGSYAPLIVSCSKAQFESNECSAPS